MNTRVKLTNTAISMRLATMHGWSCVDDHLVKSYTFRTFVDAIEFVRVVAVIAEAVDHHPDISIRWRTVVMSLSTHDVGGITDRDVSLATSIDEIAPQ